MSLDTQVKVCGLSRPEDVALANELRPEYVGFVFWPKSSRYVTEERARELRASLDRDIVPVGVFVDEDLDAVARLLEEGVIEVAQLHGAEDADYIAELQERTGKPVIRAFKVRGAEDVAAAQASGADFVLLDAGRGGGVAFDWDLVAGIERPYILAGGLTPENVVEAIERLDPFAVDVSSGVETDGFKDPAKVRRFLERVRTTEPRAGR